MFSALVLMHWIHWDVDKCLKPNTYPKLNTSLYPNISTLTDIPDTIQIYIQIVSKCGINFKPFFFCFLAFIYNFLKPYFSYIFFKYKNILTHLCIKKFLATCLQLQQSGLAAGVEVMVTLKIAAVKPIWVNFNLRTHVKLITY